MTNLTFEAEKDIKSVKEDINEIVTIVKDLDESTIRWNPTEDEWSILQIVVHVEEAIPFWLKDIEAIKADPTKKWGRDVKHEGRLYAVSEENINNVTVDKALNDVEKIPFAVKQTLEKLTDEDTKLVAPSYNPNFDGKPVQFVIDKLVVGHVNGHLGQIKRNLSKL